jgi:hypothetical protein
MSHSNHSESSLFFPNLIGDAGIVGSRKGESRFTCYCFMHIRSNQQVSRRQWKSWNNTNDVQMMHFPFTQEISRAWTSAEQSIPIMPRPTHPPQDSISFITSMHCVLVQDSQLPKTDKRICDLPRNHLDRLDTAQSLSDKGAA